MTTRAGLREEARLLGRELAALDADQQLFVLLVLAGSNPAAVRQALDTERATRPAGNLTVPVPTVSGSSEDWHVKWSPNGAWIEAPNPYGPHSTSSPRVFFVPMPVMAALLSSAREEGAAKLTEAEAKLRRVHRLLDGLDGREHNDSGGGHDPGDCIRCMADDVQHAVDGPS